MEQVTLLVEFLQVPAIIGRTNVGMTLEYARNIVVLTVFRVF
jgi:hypothetical protein